DVPEHQRAKWPHDETGGEGAQGEQEPGAFAAAGEDARDDRSQGAEDEEVIPLEGRAGRGGGNDQHGARIRRRLDFGRSHVQRFDFFSEGKVSLMTRQLFMSAMNTVSSEGQAMACAQLNWPSLRP